MPQRKQNPPGGGKPGPNFKPDWKPDWQPKNQNKGGNKGNPKRKKGKGGKKPEGYKDARRDVMLTVKPLKREIRRVRKQGTQDARQQMAQTENVYDALGATLAPLSGQYTQQAGDIMGTLNQNLGTLGGMLNTNVPLVPEGEIAAGANMFGTLGAGSLGELGSMAQRNVGYNTSAQRQGAMESGIAQRNILEDLKNFRGDLGQQKIDLMKDVPALIRQRMDQLRDTKFEQGLALSELDLRRLMANRDYGLAQQSLGQGQQQQDLAAQMYADWLALEGRR